MAHYQLPPPRSERGMALIAVSFFAMVAIAYVSATLTSTVAVHNQTRYYTASQRAHDIAESAVHHLIARLGTPAGSTIVNNGGVKGTIKGADGKVVRYEITVWSGFGDGADNDQDGDTDEPDEADLLEVRATGFYDRVARTVRVTLLARYRDAEVSSATYLADPFSSINFAGNAFTIQGQDHDMAGNPITNEIFAGIGVPNSPQAVIDQIPSGNADQITGAGGEPSVMQVTPLDLQNLIEEGARSANVILDQSHYSEDQEWGTKDAPSIVYAPGDVKVSGSAVGVGILLVDGNLEISGAFRWRGLMIVRGTVKFVGGGGRKRLIGALIVEQAVVQTSNSTTLDVRGTIDIMFSKAAIGHVMKSFATYTILNWREGPNPVSP